MSDFEVLTWSVLKYEQVIKITKYFRLQIRASSRVYLTAVKDFRWWGGDSMLRLFAEVNRPNNRTVVLLGF